MHVAPFLHGLNSLEQKAIFLSQNSPVKPAGQAQEYEFKPSTQVAPLWHLWLTQSSTLISHRPPSKPDGQWQLGEENVRLIFWEHQILNYVQYKKRCNKSILIMKGSSFLLTHICQSQTPCKCHHYYMGFHNRHQFYIGTLGHGSLLSIDIHSQGQDLICTRHHSGRVGCSRGHTWPGHHLALVLAWRQHLVKGSL